LEQIKKQLNKLINVIKVTDLTDHGYVLREMALIKVNAKAEHRAEILRITDIFRGRSWMWAGPLHRKGHRRPGKDLGCSEPAQTHGHTGRSPGQAASPCPGEP
jgi:hypothetical protein